MRAHTQLCTVQKMMRTFLASPVIQEPVVITKIMNHRFGSEQGKGTVQHLIDETPGQKPREGHSSAFRPSLGKLIEGWSRPG